MGRRSGGPMPASCDCGQNLRYSAREVGADVFLANRVRSGRKQPQRDLHGSLPASCCAYDEPMAPGRKYSCPIDGGEASFGAAWLRLTSAASHISGPMFDSEKPHPPRLPSPIWCWRENTGRRALTSSSARMRWCRRCATPSNPAAFRTPSCSPASAASARPRPPASWPAPSTTRTRPGRTRRST